MTGTKQIAARDMPRAASALNAGVRNALARVVPLLLLFSTALGTGCRTATRFPDDWNYDGSFHRRIARADRIVIRDGGFTCCRSVKGQKALLEITEDGRPQLIGLSDRKRIAMPGNLARAKRGMGPAHYHGDITAAVPVGEPVSPGRCEVYEGNGRQIAGPGANRLDGLVENPDVIVRRRERRQRQQRQRRHCHAFHILVNVRARGRHYQVQFVGPAHG